MEQGSYLYDCSPDFPSAYGRSRCSRRGMASIMLSGTHFPKLMI